MPNYSYKAARRNGGIEQGQIAAASEQIALRQLREKGLTPVRLQVASGAELALQTKTGAGQRPAVRLRRQKSTVGRAEVQSMTSELAVLLRAGLPVDRALKVQIDMSSNPAYTELLQHLLDSIKGGKPFSHALEARSQHFGNFYINMVRSGEASGRLGKVLTDLGEYLERSREVRSTVVSALIYPAILALVAVISVIVMLGFVVPQFEALFDDMGEALPGLTRAVIGMGNAVKAWWWLIAIVVAVLGYGLRNWLSSPAGKAWSDRTLLRLPLAGDVVFKYETARFSRTLGTLLGNGVSILQSINIAVNTVGNSVVKSWLESLAPASKSGRRLSDALMESGHFSPLVIQMVRVGEESGRLDEMTLELARIYDSEVQADVKRGLTLLEPILILLMGGLIAVIIVAILMGILSVNDLAM